MPSTCQARFELDRPTRLISRPVLAQPGSAPTTRTGAEDSTCAPPPPLRVAPGGSARPRWPRDVGRRPRTPCRAPAVSSRAQLQPSACTATFSRTCASRPIGGEVRAAGVSGLLGVAARAGSAVWRVAGHAPRVVQQLQQISWLSAQQPRRAAWCISADPRKLYSSAMRDSPAADGARALLCYQALLSWRSRARPRRLRARSPSSGRDSVVSRLFSSFRSRAPATPRRRRQKIASTACRRLAEYSYFSYFTQITTIITITSRASAQCRRGLPGAGSRRSPRASPGRARR